MASTEQLLTAISSMQSNAQRALPVIPNNGNPGGAYNMPQQTGGGLATAAPRGPDLSWLKPSSAMEQFTASLMNRQTYLNNRLATVRQQPQLPVKDEAAPINPEVSRPVLPMTANAPNVVLPLKGNVAWNGM